MLSSLSTHFSASVYKFVYICNIPLLHTYASYACTPPMHALWAAIVASTSVIFHPILFPFVSTRYQIFWCISFYQHSIGEKKRSCTGLYIRKNRPGLVSRSGSGANLLVILHGHMTIYGYNAWSHDHIWASLSSPVHRHHRRNLPHSPVQYP